MSPLEYRIQQLKEERRRYVTLRNQSPMRSSLERFYVKLIDELDTEIDQLVERSNSM